MAGSTTPGGSPATTTTPSTKETVSEELDLLKSDLARIKDDIGLLASTVSGRAKQGARDAQSSAQSHMNSGIDAVEQYIEEKPLTTVLVAFGIGLLLGKAFSLK